MIWYSALFSFRGRLNRQGFWIGFGINFLFLLLFANFMFDPTAFSVLSAVPLLLSAYSLAAVIIKRLHDRNRSAKALLMLVVPLVCYGVSLAAQGTMAWLLGVLMPVFIGTMLLLEWGVFAGDPNPNRYGERGLSFTLN
ncbi:DUF805 domain-containing protein [Muribacter muris]|uniref:DUF805 domain-containing protein n=1 Tax=Muribacter muris TaxID=67855 RepID=A0A4Y9JYX2_9PAST|nr:DUF805 domain-containing protein [Muribacter muris]MBF0785262.1 DUF805 domain-containing protein [Muribacter muris]MBF0828376.1 DUF805 domain-containing protein [Muribacter muris]TFV10089.1 DUF805 domain-containing protein [Muribacter muris]